MASPDHKWEELASPGGPKSLALPTSPRNTPASESRPKFDFRLYRIYSLPVYAALCFAHTRFRAWRPRKLPTITSLRPPEIYGFLMLMDLSRYEGAQLHKQLNEDREGRCTINNYAAWLHGVIRGRVRELRLAHPGIVDLTREKLPRGEDGRVSLLNEIIWRLRTMRTDEDSRMVASALLAPHIAACGLSDEDTVTLVTIVSERLKTGPEEDLVPEGLPVYLAIAATALRAASIFFGATGWVALAVNGLQRAALYAAAYPTFTWHYHHFRSIWTIKEPEKAARVVARHGIPLMESMRKAKAEREAESRVE